MVQWCRWEGSWHSEVGREIESAGGIFLNGWWKVHLKSPPPAPPTIWPLISIIFLEKNVKYSISQCYITFYEIYLNIKITLWYRILFKFLNKNQGGTLMTFSKLINMGNLKSLTNLKIDSYLQKFHILWKLHVSILLYDILLLHFLNKIQGVTLMIISKSFFSYVFR